MFPISTRTLNQSSKSASNSPKNFKLTGSSSSETFSFLSQPGLSQHNEVNKSNYSEILKNLDEIENNLENITSKIKEYDSSLADLFKHCEKSLKIVKQKVQEISTDEEIGKLSESLGLQEISSIIKPGKNECCRFLENLIGYEQAKSEIIMKKTKFPKSRLKEIDIALSNEFSVKKIGIIKSKTNDSNFIDKSKQEIKNIASKIKKKMLLNSKIPLETISITEINDIDTCSTPKPHFEVVQSIQAAIDGHKKILDEKFKLQELFDQLSKDNGKLSAKYSYLIEKLNKQDLTVKLQARILNSMSLNLGSLKEQFLKFNEEIKFYISLLVEYFIGKNSIKDPLIIPKPLLIEIPEIINAPNFPIRKNEQRSTIKFEKNSLITENELLKLKITDLEFKLKETIEKLESLEKEESDDSLDLSSNIKDIIEIQKLKDQIRLVNLKSSEALTHHQKQQDAFKAQVSRLKSDKLGLEEKIQDLNSKISSLKSEKELQAEEISKLKSQIPIETFNNFLTEKTNTEEISSRSEACQRVNPIDLLYLIQDEVDEIALKIKNNKLFVDENINSIEIIKSLVEFIVNLIQDAKIDQPVLENFRKIIEKYKKRQDFDHKIFEYDSGVQYTDPESYLVEKQLEIYKTKLADKKSQLALHKQQIAYLKKSVKDLQSEIGKVSNLDTESIKEMFGNIIKDIPSLPSSTEQMILVLMKILGFSSNEVTKITHERRSKKSNFFKGIFN